MAPHKPKGVFLSLPLSPFVLSISTGRLCAKYCAECADIQGSPGPPGHGPVRGDRGVSR